MTKTKTSHPVRSLQVEFCCPKCGGADVEEIFKAWCSSELSGMQVHFQNGDIINSEPDYSGSSDTDYTACDGSWFQCRQCSYEHPDILIFAPPDVKLMAPFPNSPLHVVSAPDTQPHQETPAA